MKKNQDLPIYPQTIDMGNDSSISYFGLTKREYFAGLAMQGLVAKYGASNSDEITAKASLEFADELLNQLDKL